VRHILLTIQHQLESVYQRFEAIVTLDIVLDRWLRPSDVVIGTRESNGIGPLTGRQFTSRLLPSTIDGTWYEILGEYTMEVHKPQSDFGWIYDTSTAY